MAGLGFKPEDFAGDGENEIWPDNHTAYLLFDSLMTQWRMGYNGPIGLDYSVIKVAFWRYRIPSKDQRNLFDDLRVMEDAAIEAIHDK